MKIFLISKVVEPPDPRLKEAARRVVDRGELLEDIVEEYHLDQTELSEEVENIRRERRLPMEEIERRSLGGSSTTRSPKNIAKALNISPLDVIWYLRRRFPDRSFFFLEEEKDELIRLKEMGLSNIDIAKKMQVMPHMIFPTLRERGREDLLRKKTDPETAQMIVDEYKSMISIGKDHNTAIKELSKKNGLAEQTLRSMILDHGIKVREREPMSEEKKLEIVESIKNGGNMKDIATNNGITSDYVRKLVKALAPEWYKANMAHADMPEEIVFFIVDNYKRYGYKKISQLVKSRFSYDLSYSTYYNLLKRHGLTHKDNVQEVPAQVEQKPQPVQEDNSIFKDLDRYVPAEIEPDEKTKQLSDFFTRLQPTPKKKGIEIHNYANKYNWYRLSQDSNIL